MTIQPRLYVGLTFVVAIVLMLASLHQSLWLDEAITGTVAQQGLNHYITQFAPTDFHPPLHYLVVVVTTRLIGPSDFSLRLPSLLFSLLTIALVMQIGKLLQPKAGLLAGLLMATSPLFIYYAIEARMYAQGTFFVCLSFYSYLKLAKQQSLRWQLFFIISLAASFLTHYLTIVMLPVYLLQKENRLRRLKEIGLSLLPLVFWFPIMNKQLQVGLAQTQTLWADLLGRATIKNVLLIPTKFILGRISLTPDWLYGIAIISLACLYVYIISRNKHLFTKHRPIIAWLIWPVMIATIISVKVPLLSYFRLLFCLPALVLLLAIGCNTLVHRTRNMIACILVVIQLGACYIYLSNQPFQREAWKSALTKVSQSDSATSLAIFTFPHQPPAPWSWYQNQLKLESRVLALVPRESLEAYEYHLLGTPTIYYFDYANDIFDPQRQILSWIKAHGYQESSLLQYPGVGTIRMLISGESFAAL